MLIWLGILPTAALALYVGVSLGLAVLQIGDRFDSQDINRLWLALVGAISLWFLSLMTRFILNRRNNPNVRFPEIGPPIRGAPIGQRVRSSGASSTRRRLEPAANSSLGYERTRPEIAPGGWITIQLSRLQSPEVCCNCMTPTTELHRYQPQSDVFANMRMCSACSRHETRKFEICISAGLIIGCLTIGPVLFWFLDAKEIFSRILYSAIGGLTGGAGIGLLSYRILARVSATAVGFRNFRSDLNTIEIRFRNQGYTDLFLDAQERQSSS